MKKSFVVLLVINLLFSFGMFGQEDITYQSGVILVKTVQPLQITKQNGAANTDLPSLNDVLKQYNVSEIRPIFSKTTGTMATFYRVNFPKTASVQTVKNALKNKTGIEKVWESAIGKYSSVPSDPLYNSNQWALQKIKADQAWSIKSGNPSIIVGVIDSGVDLGDPIVPDIADPHPDLVGNLWNVNSMYGYDVIYPYLYPKDERTNGGHGTPVAGIIGATTNNGIGVAGLAGGGFRGESGVKLMTVKISSGQVEPLEPDAAAGIEWAVDHGAKVLNMSFGFPQRVTDDGEAITYDPPMAALQAAITYAYSNGVTMVAAIGNEHRDESYTPGMPRWTRTLPAAYTANVISVAALNSNDVKGGYSNYANWCTISAPGGEAGIDIGIWTTAPRYQISSGYQGKAATSYAVPLVTGLAALILSYNPAVSPATVKNIITQTADDISAQNPGLLGKLGAGRINAATALQYLAPPASPGNLSYTVVSSHPRLLWDANTEYDIARYDIYRDLGSGFTKIGSVNKPQTYYDDYDLYIGYDYFYSAFYYVKAVDQSNLESPESDYLRVWYDGLYKKQLAEIELPKEFSIGQNYPNPFNPTTTIKYGIPDASNVTLQIYDMLGREAKELVNKEQQPGYYTVTFDAANFPSGVYFCKLQAGHYVNIKKMILQR
jgi:subtilisin family serine protease